MKPTKARIKKDLMKCVERQLYGMERRFSSPTCFSIRRVCEYLLCTYNTFLIESEILQNTGKSVYATYFSDNEIEETATFRIMMLIEFAKQQGIEL